ncbi:hypothetical protein YC2023_016201 [Brassica napus]
MADKVLAVNGKLSVEEECPSSSAVNGFDGGEKVKQGGTKGSRLSRRSSADLNEGNYDKDEDNLALMMELLGMMPHKVIESLAGCWYMLEAATPGIYSTGMVIFDTSERRKTKNPKRSSREKEE